MKEEPNKRKRLNKKVLPLFMLFGLTCATFIIATYAWFIGTTYVQTSTFEVSVSVADGLELSLNGQNWVNNNLIINETAISGTVSDSNPGYAYSGHTNHWAGIKGLDPISSNGVVDSTTGRLILYGKSSITSVSGGLRLLSTRVDNTESEQDGYVVFDLFIRNGLGEDYISEYNALDDEAVYLTRNSSVIVTPGGAQEEDYGLANSVRVAFMQVGRVKSDTETIANITGINCTDSATNTELCTNVTPTIWEPNNKRHNANLISYYNGICKNRTDLNTYTTTPCTSFTDNQDVNTYVVKQNIDSTSKTDVYDGHNGYTNTNLNNIDTFTDDMKNTTGLSRSPFLFVAPNSITKLRVYIYLEGQDVDNYDLISNGNTISINFGFTKNALSQETADTGMNLYNLIANQASNDTIDFKYHSSSVGHETNGVYKTTATEDGSTVYYYRGNVDNHVIFNNMCWRIVRTTETGGVKLIYNGIPSSGQCTAIEEDTTIGQSAFNTNYNDNAYVGYMYGTPGSSTYMATHTNTNDSTIKTYIDNWYSTNFTSSSITSKIEDTVYCNDRSTVAYDSTKIGNSSYSSYGTLGYGTNDTLYGSNYRSSYLTINPSPLLVCPQDNDKFTVSSANGNGALTYPVGLITLDEAVFAGFNTYYSNIIDFTSDYIDTNNYLYNNEFYWTFSPVIFISSGGSRVGFLRNNGNMSYNDVHSANGVRPVVSLASGTLVGSAGTGTSTNPYVVE